ncbi:2OG-Fe dioxygenase family protein [Acinetobacter baumannii]|uniref:2OG-Fe dioxygenase family protein n=1 Tax=Acinetobacter baumannii TaxID=470 RepID=UPI00244C4324|nr:2OG-Fe dioxygenase family protein [Acinetobacter baumannii]MDH2535053.1 2OG-Fe dioxygenase family protein [Acinetobacter baumannii]
MENILKINYSHNEYLEKYSHSKDITNQGYTFIDSNIFQKIQNEHNFFNVCEKDIKEFIDSWNDLDLDLFMSDKGKYRTRKHASFTIHNTDKIILKNKYIPHFQTIEYNPLNGGIARHFTEIDKKTIENPIFKNLMQFAYFTFSEIKMENWFIEAHQFRIRAKPNDTGKPTPEGIHRDGVDFVLMALINRENIQGGMTKIYDLNKKLKSEILLENFLDIALVDDHQVYHSVTKIQVDDIQKNSIGLRDVLVITFKKV